MDELVISGKRFISSRRVAKENGYHTDYIGQLIRGGKLTGQKVGRAWYVESTSLEAYLGKEGISPIEDTETPAASTDAEVTVEAMIEKSEETSANEVELQEEIPVSISKKVSVVEAETKKEIEVEEKEVADEAPEQKEAPAVEERAHIIPITIASVKAKKKTSGLVYVAEDVPRIPVLTRHDAVVVPALIHKEELSHVRSSNRAGLFGRGLALAALGVFAFLCAGAASFAFDYRIAVEGSQVSASVSLIEVAQ